MSVVHYTGIVQSTGARVVIPSSVWNKGMDRDFESWHDKKIGKKLKQRYKIRAGNEIVTITGMLGEPPAGKAYEIVLTATEVEKGIARHGKLVASRAASIPPLSFMATLCRYLQEGKGDKHGGGVQRLKSRGRYLVSVGQMVETMMDMLGMVDESRFERAWKQHAGREFTVIERRRGFMTDGRGFSFDKEHRRYIIEVHC